MAGERSGAAVGSTPTARRSAGRPRRQATPDGTDPRTQIVAVASHLFARHGVAATPMSAIAEGVGLGQSSIYYWFRNKEAILNEIVSTVNRDPLAFLARLDAEGGSPATRLHRFVRFDVRTLCELPFDINEVHRVSAQDPDTFAAYWDDRQELNDRLEALVREGVEGGELAPVDPRLAALVLLADDEGVQNWFRPVGTRQLRGREAAAGGDYTSDEIGRFMADVAVRGLLADPARLADVVAASVELDRRR